MLNLIVRVASRRFEQIEPLRPAQCFEDVIDAPAEVIPTPVYLYSSGNQSTLNGEESAIRIFGILLKEASDKLEIRNREAISVELAYGKV